MSEQPRWIIVPVLVRRGVAVQLQLPVDLTQDEAEKIARVVKAYALDGAGGDLERISDAIENTRKFGLKP